MKSGKNNHKLLRNYCSEVLQVDNSLRNELELYNLKMPKSKKSMKQKLKTFVIVVCFMNKNIDGYLRSTLLRTELRNAMKSFDASKILSARLKILYIKQLTIPYPKLAPFAAKVIYNDLILYINKCVMLCNQLDKCLKTVGITTRLPVESILLEKSIIREAKTIKVYDINAGDDKLINKNNILDEFKIMVEQDIELKVLSTWIIEERSFNVKNDAKGNIDYYINCTFQDIIDLKDRNKKEVLDLSDLSEKKSSRSKKIKVTTNEIKS